MQLIGFGQRSWRPSRLSRTGSRKREIQPTPRPCERRGSPFGTSILRLISSVATLTAQADGCSRIVRQRRHEVATTRGQRGFRVG
jgi:hypothetical protein